MSATVCSRAFNRFCSPNPLHLFTFHLKDKKQLDIGNGTKAMMKVGELWTGWTEPNVSSATRPFSLHQERRQAAGVEADKSLGENDFVIRAVINEMKGRNMEHLGKTYDLLSVKGGCPVERPTVGVGLMSKALSLGVPFGHGSVSSERLISHKGEEE